MKTKPLFAKSWNEEHGDAPPHVFLRQHLMDVYESARRVLDATADDQLSALGLPAADYRDRLYRCVLFAAAIHDLGKANDHFQGMIHGCRNIQQNPQGLRHEWVTLLMLQPLRQWLLLAVRNSEIDFAIVEWAVAGHHPAVHHESPPRTCPPGAGADITLHGGHDDFPIVLAWLKETFHLNDPPATATVTRALVANDNAFVEIAAWARAAKRSWQTLEATSEARFVAAVKNCLIAADIAGSALPKLEQYQSADWDWIPKSFASKPDEGDLQKVVNTRLDGHPPRPFQANVAASPHDITYVKASCGCGKTVAAYMWAAQKYPTRRLYVCYPTTGTATEGFKDYLFEPDGELDKLGAKLFHSRRDIDFDIILNTGPDTRHEEADAAAKIESLEAWSTPIVACTVDAVLGLVQNNRRGLFAWPALAQSAFVFDEVHAYDDRLFGALLRFLRDLPGLPALLMTASLPKSREKALRDLLHEHRHIALKPILGPKDLEELPRYHRQEARNNDPLPAIEAELKGGGKVLWVCNTVQRVMDAADRAKAQGITPLIYHSRFKYIDRVERHKEVVGAFTPEHPGGVLAVCSQVAEMSLDLKGCTMLVTDLATVPAMIQRLGRLNRQATRDTPTRPFIVIEPDAHLPYATADLDSARAWLARLPAADIQQKHLADLWEQEGDQPPELVPSAWLDGGPATTVCELREASIGITVLMEEDRPRVRSAKDAGRYTLPMPSAPKGWQQWPRERGIPFAPAGTITYDRKRGATWRK